MQEAINALKAGDREGAFDLLRRHLASNPRDAAAWLWISEAAPRPDIQRDALERALQLAPDHPQAAMIRTRLDSLRAGAAPAPAVPAAASAPAPAAEPSTDEVMAQLRGESLRARPSEPIPPLPSGEADAEVVAMGTAKPRAPLRRDEGPSSIFDTEDPDPWADDSAPQDADEIVRNLRNQLGSAYELEGSDADDAWDVPDHAEDELMDKTVSPLAPPQPATGKGSPWWVWLIILISIVIVAVAVYRALGMM